MLFIVIFIDILFSSQIFQIRIFYYLSLQMPTKLSFTLIAILFLLSVTTIIYNFLHEFLGLFLGFMLVLIIKIYCFLSSLGFIVVDFLILHFFIFLILSVLIDHLIRTLFMNIS
jgi:hypothetical protein